MAESHPTPPADQPENVKQYPIKLKYLDFVQVVVLYVIVCCSAMYEYAKQNSGPLRPGVQSVEGTVRTVIGPVYHRFHHIPFQLLNFVDRKVDDSVMELDSHVPALLKEISHQGWVAARDLASEVRRTGLTHTAKTAYVKYYQTTAREIYGRYEAVAEHYAVTAWRSLHRIPLFPLAAHHIVVPTAGYWADKYNQWLAYAADKGYTVSFYLPFVPVDRIAKVFESVPVSANGIPQ